MSFHIASQSITNPKLGLTINFKQNDADTSKVICEISTSGVTDLDGDGVPENQGDKGSVPHVLRLTFNRGGLLLYQKVTDPDGNDFHQHMAVNEIRDPSGAAVAQNVNTTQSLANPGNNPYQMTHQPVTDRTRPRPNEGKPGDDPMTDRMDRRDDLGRDPSADNPYTYQAPMDPDSKMRGDVNVGNVAPVVAKPVDPAEVPNDAEMRKEQMDKAAAAAKEAQDKREKEARMTPEERENVRREQRDAERDANTVTREDPSYRRTDRPLFDEPAANAVSTGSDTYPTPAPTPAGPDATYRPDGITRTDRADPRADGKPVKPTPEPA